MTYDAIVLCGGRATRLGGADKGSVVVGGRSLLDRALDAVAGARKIVVVGPRRPVRRAVEWTLEDPAGGGPVAGIAAGLASTDADQVVVLGVDFPFVDDACVGRIIAGLGEHEGVILVDADGHHQGLVGAYKRATLAAAFERTTSHGMAVKELLADLDLAVLEDPRSTRDCDTWDDVRSADTMLTKGAL